MTFLDDGACELTELTPGAGAFVAQVNANFAQLNAQSASLIKVRAGEYIPPKTFVSLNSLSTGKLIKAQPQVNGKHRCIGFCEAGGNTDEFLTVQIGGVVNLDLGEGAGAVYYLQADGVVDPGPVDNTDYYKKMVVALGLPDGRTLITALHNCNIEFGG